MAEEAGDMRNVVQAVVQEFLKAEQTRSEPAYKAELVEERRKRESLEQKLNDLVAEAERARAKAEAAERSEAVRTELQRLGVAKIDLAYKAVKDEVQRAEDGRLVAPDGSDYKSYLNRFVTENPELLPARIAGGSGAAATPRGGMSGAPIDLDKIRPGMSPEEMDRVRQEIARVASQTLRGM